MSSTRLLTAVAAVLVLSPFGDVGAVTSVPPAEYRPADAVPKAAAALLAPSAKPTRIVLDEPTPSEMRKLQQKNGVAAAASTPALSKHRPLAIGFARELPAGARMLQLSRLEWQAAQDGTRVARIEVKSTGAAGVRLGLAMVASDPDLAVRFAGNAPGAAVHGPYPANVIADAMARFGQFMTPVLEGDTAIVELHADEGAVVDDAALVLGPASHLVVAGAALENMSEKDARHIGRSGACNIDVACVTPPSQALTQASNSVGKIIFSDRSGFSYLCTGTLMNDARTSFTPYFLTAAHCIGGAFEASTVDVYWFFKAASCGSQQVPPFVQQSGGAMLLARSDDWDWALLRLNRATPAGTFYTGWRAEPVPTGAIGTAIHHPQGDLMKWSQGNAQGYTRNNDIADLIRMRWNNGTTEVGSSGSGLFTFLASGGYYELRGGLFGGDAACSNTSGSDYYSRLDTLLPLTRQYLTPDTPNPGSQGVVVEFYHRGLDHFFITMDPGEINVLDTGTIPGWERTGIRFLAYTAPVAGANPVCRYYLRPEVGNSHFYSADPAECAAVGQRFGASWVFESASVFYIMLPNPVTGACPSGMSPLWRFFNSRTINHRYTPEITSRDDMRSLPGTWSPEGYGPPGVIMCTPSLLQ